MPSLVHQRCFNHATREAAARCPECMQFYCRECITEHDDRVLCTSCLLKLNQSKAAKAPSFRKLVRLMQCAGGIMVAWFFFFLIGESLLRIPANFHEGTLWHVTQDNQK